MNRRQFLKVVGLGALGLPLAASRLAWGDEEKDGARRTHRWAMAIDLAACARVEGCRDCAAACHRAHNVPDIPTPGHQVKWLWKERFAKAFPEQVHEDAPASVRDRPALVMCNHCEHPPCVRVCPTGATWRSGDGIVLMDEHRCIGCRYCMSACPYQARSFNWEEPRPYLPAVDPSYPTRSRGVVEKCTLCAERLREGRLPACVEAANLRRCQALVFGDLADEGSPLSRLLRQDNGRIVLRRRPELGTSPRVFYLA